MASTGSSSPAPRGEVSGSSRRMGFSVSAPPLKPLQAFTSLRPRHFGPSPGKGHDLSPLSRAKPRTSLRNKIDFRNTLHPTFPECSRAELPCESARALCHSSSPAAYAHVPWPSCSPCRRCFRSLAPRGKRRRHAALSLICFFICGLVSLTSPRHPIFPCTFSPPSQLLRVNASVFPFDELETAHGTDDLEQPLPYPFDATACSLSAIRELSERLLNVKQGGSSFAHRQRRRRGDPALEAVEKATSSGVFIEKLERRIDLRRQAKIHLRAAFTTQGALPVDELTFFLPYHEAVQTGWLSVAQNGKQLPVEPLNSRPRVSSFPSDGPFSLSSRDSFLVDDIDLLLLSHVTGSQDEVPEGHSTEAAAPRVLPGGGVAKAPAKENVTSGRTGRTENALDVCPPFVFKTKLLKPLRKEQKAVLEIVYVIGRPYRPLPRATPLTAVQSVLFAGTSAWPSPYRIRRGVSTAVTLPSNISFGPQGAQRIREKYNFTQPSGTGGPWVQSSSSSIPEFSVERPFLFLFPLPMHLGYLLSAERYIEVSHSGKVFFHEWYRLHNDAARLEGPFDPVAIAALQGIQPGAPRLSRFLRQDVGAQAEIPEPPPSHVLTHLVAALPKRAFDLEYFDKIGNVSSSFASRAGPEGNPTYTELQVFPRFPLLGGWNTDFQVQYSLPARTAIYKHVDSSRYTLNVTLGPPFRGVYTEDIFLNIALPTGAHNITVSSPRPVDANNTSTLHSWLDIVTSRPLLHLHFHSSFVPDRYLLQHKVQITYDYPPFFAVEVFKQFQICFLIFILFALVIFLQRVRYSLASRQEKEELKVQEVTLSVRRHLLEVFEEIAQSTDDFIEAVSSLSGDAPGSDTSAFEQKKRQWNVAMDRGLTSMKKHLGLLSEETREFFFPRLLEAFECYKTHIENLAACNQDDEEAERIAQAKADLASSELLARIKEPPSATKRVKED